MKKKITINLSLVGIYIVLILVAIVTITPFYWGVISSLREYSELFDPKVWVDNPTVENYLRLFTTTLFPRWLLNSSVIAVSHTLLVLFFCSLGGYAFAKYEFRGKGILFLVILGSMMIPIWVGIIPMFIWFAKLRLINTYWVLILPGSANAFGIFLMRQYIQGIPSEMMDSARIDGCSEFQIYYKIILPVIKPVLATLTIFTFLFSWNNFLAALIFMVTEEMFTVPVGLSALVGMQQPQYGMLMAGTFISVIPVIIIFLRMQKEFVAGLTLGAVKG